MPTHRLSVKDWPEDDRPRERLLKMGARNLSLAELLAILLGSGPVGISSLDLARHFIVDAAECDQSDVAVPDADQALRRLAHGSAEVLQHVPGIGPAKAAVLLAAVELGRRVAELPPAPQVTGPSDAARLAEQEFTRYARAAQRELGGRDREHACVLLLDTKHRVIGVHPVAMGTLNEVAIHPRDVFHPALKQPGVFAVILAHNHPSGDPTPSQADLALTRRLLDAAKLVGLELVDHLIVGRGRTLSLRAQGHFG